ncbi:hypothetical protein AXK11_03630 [Cephaloticoccus primus]|uniref:Xylose isomerase-like TIM barrel domain-containing protein n=1 Tax=Cephaloticoccus primus TaxID=1548207 RepID=A0A139SQ12_9BACT|nr:hypothetical protein AXK11_03630 [Cephaloticoccus primus]
MAALCAAFLSCFGPSGCSQQGGKAEDKPVAMHMHWLRDMASEEAQFETVRAAGVRLVEISGRQSLSAEELKALLDKYELRTIGMYVGGLDGGLNELRNNLDGLVAFNKAIGNRVLVVPSVPREERPDTAQGWIALGRELGQLAERAAAAGMLLAYHNHDFEMVEFGGKTALELLFESAVSALKAEVDVAWVARGGRDPAEMLERLSGRVYSIHAKDNWPEGEGEAERGFADVGSGVLDWAAILPAAARAGVQSSLSTTALTTRQSQSGVARSISRHICLRGRSTDERNYI